MYKYYAKISFLILLVFIFNNRVFSQSIESEINVLCKSFVSDDSASVVNYRSNILKYDKSVIPFILNNITDSLSDKNKFILMISIIELSKGKIIENLVNIYNNTNSLNIKRMLVVSLFYLRMLYPSDQMEQQISQISNNKKTTISDLKKSDNNPAWRLYYFIELPDTLDGNKNIFKLFVELCEDKIRFRGGILMHESEKISSLVLSNMLLWCNDMSFINPTSYELSQEQMKNWWEDKKDNLYWDSKLKIYSVQE